MPSPERGLVTSIIDADFMEEAVELVDDGWFFDADARHAWSIAKAHWDTHRETISRELLLEQFPAFTFEVYSAKPLALIRIVENRFLRNRFLAITEEAGEEDDIRGMLATAVTGLTEVQAAFENGDTLQVDFESGEIILEGSQVFQAQPFSQVQMDIYQAGNLFAYGKSLEG